MKLSTNMIVFSDDEYLKLGDIVERHTQQSFEAIDQNGILYSVGPSGFVLDRDCDMGTLYLILTKNRQRENGVEMIPSLWTGRVLVDHETRKLQLYRNNFHRSQ